jgi:hypothetical protein
MTEVRFPTATELAEKLADHMDGLVGELLPAAKRHGRCRTVGNVQGDPGDSMNVIRSGAKAGRWTDYASGQFGDALDLVNAALFGGRDMREAMKWASTWLGLDPSIPKPAVPPREARPKPHQHDDARSLPPLPSFGILAGISIRNLGHRISTGDWHRGTVSATRPGGEPGIDLVFEPADGVLAQLDREREGAGPPIPPEGDP